MPQRSANHTRAKPPPPLVRRRAWRCEVLPEFIPGLARGHERPAPGSGLWRVDGTGSPAEHPASAVNAFVQPSFRQLPAILAAHPGYPR